MDWQPLASAILNGTAGIFLVLGYLFIRQKEPNKIAHKKCMLTAVSISTLFLINYVVYHYLHGSTKYQGIGWTRTFYFVILISHVILATVIVPFVARTLWVAFKEDFEKHKRVARYTFAMWLYVSVTGVIIYYMLYVMKV